MKKSGLNCLGLVFILLAICFYFVINFNFALAEDVTSPVSDQDLQSVQSGVSQLPITDEGQVDTTKLKDYQSNLEKSLSFLKEHGQFLKYIVGAEFDFTKVFFFIFCLWLFYWMSFFNIIKSFSSFSEWVSLGIGFLMAVMLANTGVVLKTFNIISYLLDAWWTWLIAFVLIILLMFVESGFGSYFKKMRENREEMKAKQKQALDRIKLHGEVGALDEMTKPLRE